MPDRPPLPRTSQAEQQLLRAGRHLHDLLYNEWERGRRRDRIHTTIRALQSAIAVLH